MVSYKCNICDKEFKQKGHYTYHINRKNKCIEINTISPGLHKKSAVCTKNVQIKEFKCGYCNKDFCRKYTLNRHVEICDKKTITDVIEKDNQLKEELFKTLLKKMEILEEQNDQNNDNMKKYEKRLSYLKVQNDKLQEEIRNLKSSKIINNTNNTNTNCNNTINQTINILSYKNTDMSHIKFSDYMKCLNRSNYCVPQLVEDIHFNPNKPENHNIYIPNLKNNLIMLYDGKDWNLHNRDDTIDEIYEDKTNILVDKIEDWEKIGKNINEVALRKFNRYLGKKDTPGISNKIKDEIKLILYNKRNMVKLNKN